MKRPETDPAPRNAWNKANAKVGNRPLQKAEDFPPLEATRPEAAAPTNTPQAAAPSVQTILESIQQGFVMQAYRWKKRYAKSSQLSGRA